MKKLLLYGHGGAYNHGAEAILRSSLPIFRKVDVPIFLSTHFPEQDREFGLDKLVNRLIPADLTLIPQEKTSLILQAGSGLPHRFIEMPWRKSTAGLSVLAWVGTTTVIQTGIGRAFSIVQSKNGADRAFCGVAPFNRR